MDDEDYEPTPKSVAPATPAVASPETRPFARQAAVAHHEVRFTVKKGREQNMLT